MGEKNEGLLEKKREDELESDDSIPHATDLLLQ
jgi:hypothetical protein